MGVAQTSSLSMLKLKDKEKRKKENTMLFCL
jgi:hypothetical protein